MKSTRTRLRGEAVPSAFDRAAMSYDKLVAVNPGYHRHLRASVRRLRLPNAGAGLQLLDAGCGTGASTAALLAVAPRAEITAVDASGEMLERARRKNWPSTVRFVHAPVAELADAGVRGPFDGILAAYLIRNLADPIAQLRSFRDLLRPGGTLAVHEYSVRDSLVASAVWQAVCLGIIIPAGFMSTGDSTLFQHLRRSVVAFDGARQFQRKLGEAGFISVHEETMTGWQREIVHTFLATRPADPDRGCGGS